VPKSFAGAKQPQLAIEQNGDVLVAFGRSNSIYFTSSTDDAKSFGSPQLVATVPKLALGMRRGPRIVATRDAVVVSAVSHETGDLFCWRLNGPTWSKAIRVNDEPRAAREGLHAMAAYSNTIAIAWLDLRTGKTDLHGAISYDDGATWSKNFLIYRSLAGHICECCHPSLAFDSNGRLFAMWRNYLKGSRDMYFASANGTSFLLPEKLGSGTWPLNACPMDGGSFVISNHVPISVWRRGTNIFSASNSASETLIASHAAQPVISGQWIAWQSNGDVFAKHNRKSAVRIAENASYPSIVSANQHTILVWENSADGAPILCKTLQ
jgi:hypothetical protein